jgi:Putative esterase
MVAGSTLSFLENGVERIAVYGPGLADGAPGILASGTGQIGNWSGGTAGFEAHYLSTDANGAESYDMISASDGYGPQILRVLRPADPAPGVAHNFLFVLPVEPGLGTSYGDGLATVEAANAQNQYNLTVIEPSFAINPWYANNPGDPNLQYQTFMTTELEPWVKADLATTGTEQNWLLGFSKSGLGAEGLLLKHPGLFTFAASWDFPADMANYAEFGTISTAEYGTDAFTGSDRIWISG